MNSSLRRFLVCTLAAALALSLPLRAQTTMSGTSAEGEFVPGPNPGVKYPVAHFSGGLFQSFDYGWLIFTRDTIRYEVVRGGTEHGFSFNRSELEVAKEWTTFGLPNRAAELRFRGLNYHFWQVARSNLESGRARSMGYQDLINVASNPEDALAMAEARYNRLNPPKPTVGPPPSLSMLEPAGAADGQTVSSYDATLRVRGIASQSSGIASVTVNGQTAFFKPLAPQTVEFDLRDLPLASGMSAVVIVATGNDKSIAQMTFRVSRPEVRVLEPASGSETTDAAVKVRGLAVGFSSEVERVEVAGQTSTLRRRDDGSVEFEVASVPLSAIGSVILQGYVLTRSGGRLDFRIPLTRKPPPGPAPLTLAEVEKALADLPKKRVAEMVSQYGVDFELTDDAEKRLRDAGADSNLLLAIAKAKK